jgi:hypothetical protein
MNFFWMSVLGSFVVVGLISWYRFGSRRRKYRNNELSEKPMSWRGMLLCHIIFSFVLGLFIWFLPETIAYNKADLVYEKDYEYAIVGLQDSQQTTFTYARRSYLQESMVYYHMYPYNGGKKMGSIPANKTTVYEDGEKKIIVLKAVYKNKWLRNYFNYPSDESRSRAYELHVPQGTIAEDINIDMK